MNREVAISIAVAMRASDLGKWYKLDQGRRRQSGRLGKLIGQELDEKARVERYALKNAMVMRAITLIRSDEECGFGFEVESCTGFDKPCWVVMFDFEVKAKHHQVAFHTFNDVVGGYATVAPGPSHWEGDSSREACIALLNWLEKN